MQAPDWENGTSSTGALPPVVTPLFRQRSLLRNYQLRNGARELREPFPQRQIVIPVRTERNAGGSAHGGVDYAKVQALASTVSEDARGIDASWVKSSSSAASSKVVRQVYTDVTALPIVVDRR